MASPFTVFRKNQKVLLAITGILAMIAFVFLGTCTQTIGTQPGYQNPTVVSWKFGEIKESEMSSRMQMRVILNKFLQDAVQRTGRRTTVQFFPQTEDAVMRSMVLARRGREMGLVVTDEVVNRFLAGLTNNRLRPVEFEQLAGNFHLGGQRVTPKMIFDALREELLADNVGTLFDFGTRVHTPAQRWDYYKRFEQRVTAQVLSVPVAEFTDEVKPPSDKELQELFDRYKDRYYQPGSPEPGFRQPDKARFQYFRAEIEPLIAAETTRIPEEELREYYEKNKDTQFRAAKLSPLDTDATKESAKKEDSGKKKDSGKKEDSQKTEDSAKDNDSKADAAKDGKEETTKEPANPAGKDEGAGKDDAKSSAKSGEQSGANKSDQDAKNDADGQPGAKSDAADGGDPKSGDAKKGAEPDQSAQRLAATPFRLVKFQDDRSKNDSAKSEAAKNDASKSDTAKKDAAAKNDDAKVDAAKSDAGAKDTAKSKAATDTSGKADPGTADAGKDATKDDATKDDASKDDASKDDASKKDAAAEPVEYRPLEKVRDEIARTLARQRVQERIDERLKSLGEQIVGYGDRRMRWQRNKIDNPDEPEPKLPDLQALAQDHRVKHFNTDWLSRTDALTRNDLDIATSRIMELSQQFYRPWIDVVFEPKGLYRPITTRIPNGDSFLSWKTDEREGHIPEFPAVRQDVLEAYQRIHARGLARKQAEAYAKTVRDAKQPMKEVFAQDKNLPVKEVGPFPWLTRPGVPLGMMQQPAPQYSSVAGVENPGEEFMRTAFTLGPDEVGVAFNHAQSIAYVIQAVGFDPSERVLEQEFMVRMKNYERYRAAGNDDAIDAETHWMESLLAEYGVHWHRTSEARAPSLD